MNKYFTPLLDVTLKLPVWYEFNSPASATIVNTRCVSVFLGSIGIGTSVYIALFLGWFK